MIRKRIPRRGPIPEAVNLKCDSGCASAELSYRQLPEHDELMVFQFDESRVPCRVGVTWVMTRALGNRYKMCR
jgi:hypothetical protein